MKLTTNWDKLLTSYWRDGFRPINIQNEVLAIKAIIMSKHPCFYAKGTVPGRPLREHSQFLTEQVSITRCANEFAPTGSFRHLKSIVGAALAALVRNCECSPHYHPFPPFPVFRFILITFPLFFLHVLWLCIMGRCWLIRFVQLVNNVPYPYVCAYPGRGTPSRRISRFPILPSSPLRHNLG